MDLKPLKNGEVAVTVTYHITEDLVGQKISYLRAYSRLKASEGIPAIYIDDQERMKPTATLTFSEPGEHIVRIVLQKKEVIPVDFLRQAEHIYSVEIPETVTTIEAFAFRWTHLVCPPVLPPNLTVIEKCAFDGAYVGVESIKLPDSVYTLGDEAFGGIPHLIVGKQFFQYVNCLRRYEKVTIPDDNLYLEVKDGFIINKSTQVVEGILPGTFEDSADVTIRFPEGITGFDPHIIELFHKASVFLPGSVKEIEIYGNDTQLNLAFPKDISHIALHRVHLDELHIPEGCLITYMACSINRLYLGNNVRLEWKKLYGDGVFDGFKGEVFVEGTLHFDKWGGMEDGSSIHVPDRETGEKILYTSGFNKSVQIFIGQSQALTEKADRIPGFPFTLKPVESDRGSVPDVVTLLFNFPAKTTVEIQARASSYILDDGEPKKFRNKIALPKGEHIVRLVDIRRLDDEPSYGASSAPAIEPACEAMLIEDSVQLSRISKRITGVKHLILGAQCNITELRLPVERIISVVPENQWLESRDGCLIRRENKKLLFVAADAQKLPNDILEMDERAFRAYQGERLVIPGSVKKAYLHSSGSEELSNLKELVFEEGVEEIVLYEYHFRPELKISLPASLKKLSISELSATQLAVPASCAVDECRKSQIAHLEFHGDVSLVPGYFKVFDKFSGNIIFHGEVTLAECFGTPNDDCTITVASHKIANAIKKSPEFNQKVKVITRSE